MNEPVQQPGPPPVPAKKGIPALAWVGIGCGGLVILAGVLIFLLVGWFATKVGDLSEFQRNPEKAAAEMVVRFSPDIEMVSQDEAAGEMTIRTKDGKEMTLSYKDIAEGKFRMTGPDGSMAELGAADLSKVPDWVPRVPGMISAKSSFRTERDGRVKGMYSATSSLGAEELDQAISEELGKLGPGSSTRTTQNVNGSESRTLGFKVGKRQVQVIITAAPGSDTLVNVAYEEGL